MKHKPDKVDKPSLVDRVDELEKEIRKLTLLCGSLYDNQVKALENSIKLRSLIKEKRKND